MILAIRTLFLGALVVVALHFGFLARRRRDDVMTKHAAVFAAHALVVVGARVVLASGPTAFEAALATRVMYSVYVVGSLLLPLTLGALRRREVWGAGAVAVLLGGALWWNGGVFAAEVVHRAPTQTESFHILAPGPLWPVAVVAMALLMAFSAWAGARSTEPALRRLLRLVAPAVAAALVWDMLLDGGLVRGPILVGWSAGLAILSLTWVGFRRAGAAHGDLVERLEKERLALVEEEERLAAREHLSALGSLAEGLGHELNNPLAAVSLNLAWLEEDLAASSRKVPASVQTALGIVGELRTAMHDFTSRFRPAGPKATSVPPSSAPRALRPKVLVVDDDPLITKALRRSLVGFAVSTANSADEAIGAIGATRFDAILCDVMMPEITGVDLYRQVLDAQPELARRFVFLTGGSFGEGAEDELGDLGCPVLRKPVDVRQIAKTLRRRIMATHLGSEQPEPDPAPASLGTRRR